MLVPDSGEAISVTVEDSFHLIVRYLGQGTTTGHSDYGYDLYLPNVINHYLRTEHRREDRPLMARLSPAFYAAAWDLCRRGILRPGVTAYGEQDTGDGSAGNGYSLTPTGREWLEQAGQYDVVPLEPGRFSHMLASFGPRFGDAFLERSQEAMRCYGANAFLACCAMCGAAAEAAIIALAAAKTGDETHVLKDWATPGGRGRVENSIIGQQPPGVRNEFLSSSSLLKYWRDVAAHGQRANISGDEAYTALALLLRFARFVDDKWGELT